MLWPPSPSSPAASAWSPSSVHNPPQRLVEQGVPPHRELPVAGPQLGNRGRRVFRVGARRLIRPLERGEQPPDLGPQVTAPAHLDAPAPAARPPRPRLHAAALRPAPRTGRGRHRRRRGCVRQRCGSRSACSFRCRARSGTRAPRASAPGLRTVFLQQPKRTASASSDSPHDRPGSGPPVRCAGAPHEIAEVAEKVLG